MNQPGNVPPLFTPEELAAQLGVDIETLRALREKGTGPAYIKIGPRIVRYLGWDVGEWLAESAENEP
ncbi:helix-turn-helix transcriptional regulator [Leifsonia shinshuensis]